MVGECDIKLGRPLQHLSTTFVKTSLTQANNFRIHLVVGRNGLQKISKDEMQVQH